MSVLSVCYLVEILKCGYEDLVMYISQFKIRFSR